MVFLSAVEGNVDQDFTIRVKMCVYRLHSLRTTVLGAFCYEDKWIKLIQYPPLPKKKKGFENR